MTRRNSWMIFGALLIAALFLAGCGGSGDAGEMGPPGPPGDAPSAEEIEEIVEEVVAEQPAAPAPDTSEQDEKIAALEGQIAKLTAEPKTIPELLGGKKGTASAADLAASATKIAGQLNAVYDHDEDKSLVNLPDIAATTSVDEELTRNIMHVAGKGIMSADGTSDDKGFLKHSFTDGPMVDLRSPEDIKTLGLTNLLDVNSVSLKSFTLKETDKVRIQADGTFDATNDTFSAVTPGTDTLKTVLRKDGSSYRVVTDGGGNTVFSEVVTYVGGSKVVEYDSNLTVVGAATTVGITGPAAGTIAMVTRADGDTIAITQNASNVYEIVLATNVPYDPANPTWTDRGTGMLPSADQANAKAAYNNAGSSYTIAQHNAMGYGAWLEDSFFAAYVINAEDDAILNDPDSMAMKIAWGGRAHDSEMATDLSGRGSTAMWKGLMVGHDMHATAATKGKMVKGSAMITAHLGAATLADQTGTSADAVSLVDVSLTNIITADGTAVSRVPDGIEWTNLDLMGAAPGRDGVDEDDKPIMMPVTFSKGSEISGAFYDGGDEVVGMFNKESILGVFGAREYEAMEDMMDMAGQ